MELLIARRGRATGDSQAGGDGRARIQLLALLTKARQQIAVAKVGATSDFVSRAIEQGEKVIVFSCFDEPLQTLAKDLGDAAVLLTGKTPTHKRQALVDRFQQDETVRVFLANIIAGGVGLNLTAASQVVFNDLDWVPANHWQAEDRAYRIGQTRTVNVAYLVGTNTVDDFVLTVLEAKSRLVSAVVDGGALAGDLTGSVLDELERALRAILPASPIRRREPWTRRRSSGSSGTRPPNCGRRRTAPGRGRCAAAARGYRGAQARAGSPRARALRALSESLPHVEHVAARRRLCHHG